jgi:DNA polymerase-3 subunit delta'
MRQASADALLKLIEEPPPQTVIVLTASRPEALLPTIRSRSQKIKISRVNETVITDYLQERYKISESKARLYARLSEGSPGKAVQMMGHDGEDETSRRAVGFLLFKTIIWQNGADILAHLNELVDLRDRSEAEQLLSLWQSLIRDCATFAVNNDESSLVNIDFSAEIKKMAPFFTNARLALHMADNIKITLADLRRNVHIQGALSAVALKLKRDIMVA